MISILKNHNPNVIAFEVSGTVTKEDIKEFESATKKQFNSKEKLNVIMFIRDFKGYTLKGLLEDISFGFKHMKDFSKAAVVSDKKWLETIVKIEAILPFVEVKHFDPADSENAWMWVNS